MDHHVNVTILHLYSKKTQTRVRKQETHSSKVDVERQEVVERRLEAKLSKIGHQPSSVIRHISRLHTRDACRSEIFLLLDFNKQYI